LSDLAAGIVAGDRRALARAITLVESTRTEDRAAAEDLLDQVLPRAGDAVRIGITGSPGVGKSTFIEAFGHRIIEAGHRVAVLAVDPSSARTGGSILGDKTRMGTLASDPNAFIRPSPSGPSAGGVARRTREAMTLCEAFGFDVVLVETVGAGQAEGAVADLVDLFVLLVPPGGGDELQGIKRGIMELADLLVVTKADGDLAATARHTASDYGHALQLVRPKAGAGPAPVLTASALTGEGIAEVWDTVEDLHRRLADSGALAELRRRQATAQMWAEVDETLDTRFREAVAADVPAIESAVAAGDLSPTTAAHRLLDLFRSLPR
jgi:LAO/AO transport system kinase